MFTNFATELAISGNVEIIEIGEMEEVYGNNNIKIKGKTTRRRVDDKGNLVYDHDIVSLKLWSSGASFIKEKASVGDILQVRGEIRGRYPNIDIRVKSFEILNIGMEDYLQELIDDQVSVLNSQKSS